MSTEAKPMVRLALAALVLLFLPELLWASEYDVKREWGEPVGSFAITSGGVKSNETTLSRKQILLHEPTCPVEILSYVNYLNDGSKFECTPNLDCTYGALTYLHVENPIMAIELRTNLFDVFGEQIASLRNRAIQDLSPGRHDVEGVWDSDYSTVEGLMVTVTYVARVLLADGTQWTYNGDKLLLVLSDLDLGQKFRSDKEE